MRPARAARARSTSTVTASTNRSNGDRGDGGRTRENSRSRRGHARQWPRHSRRRLAGARRGGGAAQPREADPLLPPSVAGSGLRERPCRPARHRRNRAALGRRCDPAQLRGRRVRPRPGESQPDPAAPHTPQRNAIVNLNFYLKRKMRRMSRGRPLALPPMVNVGHHNAHAATFFVSPFEEATVLVMDGYGDDASTSTYIGAAASSRAIGARASSTPWAWCTRSSPPISASAGSPTRW